MFLGMPKARSKGSSAQGAKKSHSSQASSRRQPEKKEAEPRSQRCAGGIMRHDLCKLTDERAMDLYQRDQVLWLRLPQRYQQTCSKFGISALQKLQNQCPSLFSSHWSVENPGMRKKEQLTAKQVFAKRGPPSGRYYVSSILQKDGQSVAKFFRAVPFAEPELLVKANALHDDGVWLFVGSNPKQGDEAAAAPSGAPKGKRKRGDDDASPLTGRPEHTDAVDHSGTWHVQLQGSKTWFIRPAEDAEDWQGRPPRLEAGGSNVVGGAGRGGTRLRIECGEGDWLLINTRAWWHRTELAAQEDGAMSISYARDFYLGAAAAAKKSSAGSGVEHAEEKTNDDTLDPRMYAARGFKSGDVIMLEEELPDGELPRSKDPNCSLAEMDDDSVALVSIRKIRKGEPLSIGVGDDSDSDEYEEWELDPETGEMFKVEAEE